MVFFRVWLCTKPGIEKKELNYGLASLCTNALKENRFEATNRDRHAPWYPDNWASLPDQRCHLRQHPRHAKSSLFRCRTRGCREFPLTRNAWAETTAGTQRRDDHAARCFVYIRHGKHLKSKSKLKLKLKSKSKSKLKSRVACVTLRPN